ncbi:MAG: histidine kinase [Gammaproteobacteria bacterium]|nr:histidine kinase [Gammaproteobacteria bacterium]
MVVFEMVNEKGTLTKKRLAISFALQISANTLIAILLTSIGGHFEINFIFSQYIGILTFAILHLLMNLFQATTPTQKIIISAVSVALGAASGAYLSIWTLRQFGFNQFDLIFETLYRPILVGLVIGGLFMYYYYSKEKILDIERRIQVETMHRLAGEKHLLETELKLIQAQIEPHFLFNTLATVSGLLERDAVAARKMLENLIVYLRTSLARTRTGELTLSEEIELLRAYLSIMRMRMGERLTYELDIPPALLAIPFPPLLIQPLVENAIHHGLEPKINGGHLRVSASVLNQMLTVNVEDNGLGIKADWSPGVGLENVRARLKLLYGESARLEFVDKPQGGVTVQMQIPQPESPRTP